MRWPRWQSARLRTKILIPTLALMLASLVVSIAAFLVGTARTQRQVLTSQAKDDLYQASAILDQRASSVVSSAQLLSADDRVLAAMEESDLENLQTLNQRAVVIRDRMGLDLIQIYDHDGHARANLLTSHLYLVSELIESTPNDGVSLLHVRDRLLLIGRATMPDGKGVVLVAYDLASELLRMARNNRMLSNLAISCPHTFLCDDPTIKDVSQALELDRHVVTLDTQLAGVDLLLVAIRPTADLRQITGAGLTIMVISMAGTSLVLALLLVVLTRRLMQPVSELALVAQSVAENGPQAGERLASMVPDQETDDEVGLLAQSFFRMVEQLADLYAGLEDRVALRTRQLAQAEERYRRLYEEDLSGVFIADRQGRITVCNPAYARIVGYDSPSKVIGEPLSLHLADPEGFHELASEIQSTGRVENREVQARTQDGSERSLLLSAIAFERDGQIAGIQGYILDLTETKHLEEQLNQAQKMEAIGRLAGGIAHDFNNLLTVIIGYCDLLLWTDEEEQDTAPEIRLIKKAGQRAASLTGQLLASSRKQILQPEVLDLNAVISDLSEMLERLLGEDVQMHTSLASDLEHIEADPSQIEQVLMNLAINAREAMPNGGSLAIRTENVSLGADSESEGLSADPGPHAVIEVSDTGIGMDEETLKRVFEPFFTTKESGTGLGLATVHGIVRQSGGDIRVSSELGKGTRFRVFLPVARASSPPERAAERPGVCYTADATLLLVEDEDMLRNVASTALRREGYTVVSAANGRQAPDMDANWYDIDLVISDVVMPEMGGIELASDLSRVRPDLPVLFMTGYADSAVLRDSVWCERAAFLQKPFSPHGLIQAVGAALSAADHQNEQQSEHAELDINAPKR